MLALLCCDITPHLSRFYDDLTAFVRLDLCAPKQNQDGK